METFNFRPGPDAQQFTDLNRKPITLVSVVEKPDGLWGVYNGETSKPEKLNQFKDMAAVREYLKNCGWYEVKSETVSASGPKCECGAAFTSNPNLHSNIMPCPLYRKGA